ncbi:uncharacterized protein [Eucyclogobius newberryi]|uniref:uncharacterized protein n=1 Tax=Eucyclogobius newberryi TaxID=166745 RepID=UPI003B5A1392
MAQAYESRDNQALLQSMLQRLKLQAGTTNIQPEQNTTGGQNLECETLGSQTVVNNNNNPINGFELTDKINSEFTVNGKQLDLDSSLENSGASGHSQEHGQGSQSGQHFSPNSAYAASPISPEGSFNLSNSETKDISQEQSAKQKQDQDSGFVPKEYAWATQTAETPNNEVTQIVISNQNPTNNRKQRSSENKTRKWTQKIKAKWRDRPGSFGKKNRFADMTTQENSPQYQPPTHLNFPSVEESGRTTALDDRTDHLQIRMANGNDECVRSTNEFDLGLGQFSLLDEIVSGQEWAKFLNPATSTSVREGPSQETNYHDEKSRMNSTLSEHNVGNDTHIFGTSAVASNKDIAMSQVSLEPSSHVGMDISQMQSEPMEHGQRQSDMQVTVSDEQLRQLITNTGTNNTVDNSSLRGGNSLSRKRQHQSFQHIENFPRVIPNGNDTVDDGSVFLPNNYVMDNIGGKSMFFFSSTTKPVPRGVLKSTLSCDSAYSAETVNKKRRMEETRHVHFSEEIITIDPPELGPDVSESEEESEEEDSFFEEDSEEHTEPTLLGPLRPEEAVPARRHALPAWIRALKRRNTGKKPG